MYQVNIADGYIISVVKGAANGNLTEVQYKAIKSKLGNRPVAAAGYDYRLTVDLAWELYKLPEPVEDCVE